MIQSLRHAEALCVPWADSPGRNTSAGHNTGVKDLAFFICLPVSSHTLDAACFLFFPDWMRSTELCDPTPDAHTPSLLFARTCHMLLMDFLEVENFPLVLSICHHYSTDFSLFFSFVLLALEDTVFWDCLYTVCRAGRPSCSVSAGVLCLIKIWGVSGVSPITEH